MLLKLVASVACALRRDDETGVYVSFCPALSLYSQGTSEEQSRQALEGAIKLFLSTCYDRKQLDRALQEAGFQKTSSGMGTPLQQMGDWIAIQEAKYDEAFEVEVPLHLIAAKHAELAGCQQ